MDLDLISSISNLLFDNEKLINLKYQSQKVRKSYFKAYNPLTTESSVLAEPAARGPDPAELESTVVINKGFTDGWESPGGRYARLFSAALSVRSIFHGQDMSSSDTKNQTDTQTETNQQRLTEGRHQR